MKKVYSTIIAIGIVTINFSQVVLQATDLNPNVGESFNYNNTNWISAGPAGSNITWDLSAMTTTSSNPVNIVAPSVLFPQANVGLSVASQGVYYQDNNTGGQYIHGMDVGGTIITFQNDMQIMAFPLSNTTFANDTHSGTFVSSGYSFVRSGTTTIEGDGYGTLITPDGTFTNVVRVRLDQIYTDVYSLGTIYYDTQVYQWYKAGIHYPLASVTTVFYGASYMEYGGYLLTAGLGIESSSAIDFSVYPNPTTDEFNVISDAQISSVEIFDAVGKMVKQIEMLNFDSSLSISIGDLNSGVYFVKVRTSEGIELQMQRVVKN